MKILVFLNEEDNYAKNKRYIMGGATASSQYEGGYKEGGKGLDTQDFRFYLKRTSDATTSTGLLTQDIIDEAIDDGVDYYVGCD